MKVFVHTALLITLVSVFPTVSPAGRTAHAQTAGPDAPAQANPVQSAPAPSSEQSKSIAPQATTQPSTPRERREQAYMKLLEGQRYYSDLKRNPSDPAARQATEQAFQQAAALDPTLAEAHTALAELSFYFSPQNLDQATREAELATSIDRNNFGAHRILARIYSIKSGLRDNNLDKAFVERAVAELREIVRLNSNDAEAWALLGEFYLATGRKDEAINALTNWAAAPEPIDTRFFQFITNRALSTDSAAARLGEVLLGAGRTNEALAAIRRAISLNPENQEYGELLSQAFEAGGGDDNSAIAELQGIAAANPTSTNTLRLLARAQARAGRVDDAAATLRAAIAQRAKGDREQLLLRLSLAQVFSDALRYEDAIAVYEEILKDRGIGNRALTSADDRAFASEVLHRIIGLQKSAGQTSEVTATIERMRRLLGKDDPSADAEYIGFLRSQGKRSEALQAIRAARQRFPSESTFVQLEADTLSDLGQVDEAVALLRPRLKGSLEDFGVYLTISNLYYQAGRGREAVEAARKALELAPSERQDLVAAALIMLSSAQERAGDPKGSEESLRRILAKDPNNATALNNLGYFLVERNERLAEALEMIQRAVRAEPTNASFLDSLGWAYFKLGQLDEAERHLSDAARRNAASATIQEHLGDLYHKRGKMDLARAAWEKALALSVEADEMTRIKAKLNGLTKK
ncbi:MAG TPA: tetratricopeptide repeat protein [Pyrinomonadaceae bacterium]|nr:tetratricopeptide repeat protein [Pyrinomonadaceae bacterium]